MERGILRQSRKNTSAQHNTAVSFKVYVSIYGWQHASVVS